MVRAGPIGISAQISGTVTKLTSTSDRPGWRHYSLWLRAAQGCPSHPHHYIIIVDGWLVTIERLAHDAARTVRLRTELELLLQDSISAQLEREAQEYVNLPLLPGAVVVVRDGAGCREASSVLQQASALGVDAEWQPSVTGASPLPSLLQVFQLTCSYLRCVALCPAGVVVMVHPADCMQGWESAQSQVLAGHMMHARLLAMHGSTSGSRSPLWAVCLCCT